MASYKTYRRLPREFSSIIVAVLYHPPSADDTSMQSHLFQTLSEVEAKFYSCGIIIAGDFNRLNVNQIIKHFRLKQIVKSPTRGKAILDLVLTNMHEFYKSPQILPLIGLSDHSTVVVSPAHIVKKAKPTFVYKRDLRQS